MTGIHGPRWQVLSGSGGGFTRPIPGDGGADQLRGVPVIGRLSTDGTRGPEVRGYGRIWSEADGPVQGSLARDVKGPVIQNHSCCMKEFWLDQPCGDKVWFTLKAEPEKSSGKR